MMSLFLLASVVTCNEEVLIINVGMEQYDIDFFNLIFYSDESRIEACKFLENKEITLEKEPLGKDSYYIYANNRLIQEIAIEEEWAKINLNYPEYLHIIEEDEMVISINSTKRNTNNHSIFILISMFFIFLVSFSLYIMVSKL